jgi:hypothetical protein
MVFDTLYNERLHQRLKAREIPQVKTYIIRMKALVLEELLVQTRFSVIVLANYRKDERSIKRQPGKHPGTS